MGNWQTVQSQIRCHTDLCLHCLQIDQPFFFRNSYILEEFVFDCMYVRLYDIDIPKEKMVELYANTGDPDQMLHSAASDLGLHWLTVTV